MTIDGALFEEAGPESKIQSKCNMRAALRALKSGTPNKHLTAKGRSKGQFPKVKSFKIVNVLKRRFGLAFSKIKMEFFMSCKPNNSFHMSTIFNFL